MKRSLKIILGVAIFLAAIGISALLWITKPQAETSEDEKSLPSVETMTVRLEPVTFDIPSQGVVEADRRVRLASEVSGKVVETAKQFEAGNAFEKDSVLVRIDPADYEAAVAQARSNLADAESALASEEARAEQAERDVRRLGGEGSDLALRKPQLESARARVESARASLAKAGKDLSRTAIRAPFDSIVASTATEVGSYVTPGTEVAEVFGTSPFEVRLPLSVDEMPFLKTSPAGEPTGRVRISATAAGTTETWTGTIVRTEGEIDRSTRSIHVVAEIESPSGPRVVGPRPGLFVQASIPGREIPGIARIPFSAFLDLERVMVVDPDDRLRFREVGVVFREGRNVYVSSGLEDGDRVCLTELSDPVEGILVSPRPVGESDDAPDSDPVPPSSRP
ncbi:MAG: efflux RND transporter periplasmic adaptor subunit [Verrucomicrobiales bacterium]